MIPNRIQTRGQEKVASNRCKILQIEETNVSCLKKWLLTLDHKHFKKSNSSCLYQLLAKILFLIIDPSPSLFSFPTLTENRVMKMMNKEGLI